MSALRPLPYRKVAKALVSLGFRPVRQKGSHVLFRHDDGRTTIRPHHPGEDISVGLLRKVLRDVGMDPDEFNVRL